MKLAFTTLDVFTTTRYAGNPLAVIEVPASQKTSLTQTQKQKIAAEFNLSEIIFLHLSPPDAKFNPEPTIDIFTIAAEVPFAGHPTVGAAYFLLQIQRQPAVALIEKAGRIPISADSVTGDVKAEVPQDFHVHTVTYQSELTTHPAPCISIVKGMSFILVELPDLATLGEAKLNLSASYDPTSLDEGWKEGLVGTMYFVGQGEDEFGRKRYRTRMFADWTEDPGTGSASCGLGCWLASREEKANEGPFRFAFTQGVEIGRKNDISVEVVRSGDEGAIKSVLLSGTAVRVMEGSLEV